MKEITAVLHKHAITRGVSPEKLRMILEDLGPTYIKLGQIMSLRSDILPKRYCDELMKLCSDVAPMPFDQVVDVIQDAFGCPWQEEFQSIEEKPLGSASIAQVHRAVLKSGEQVVIKVQRKGIYRTMARDIGLMHKVVRLLPPVSIKEMVDLDLVLDELWKVTQEEMNFLTEAANIEEFHRKNRDVAFVDTPVLYREYTTPHVIVMEYIDGFSIDDKENLQENGYDLNEVGSKLIDNFIKQVMVDGFFHADPHPGNLRVRDGKIVWIDMGMMGRLSEHDREEIGRAIEGIALNDIGMIQDAVLAIGEFRGKPDQSKLFEDIRNLMANTVRKILAILPRSSEPYLPSDCVYLQTVCSDPAFHGILRLPEQHPGSYRYHSAQYLQWPVRFLPCHAQTDGPSFPYQSRRSCRPAHEDYQDADRHGKSHLP